jgi:hypothetical protein
MVASRGELNAPSFSSPGNNSSAGTPGPSSASRVRAAHALLTPDLKLNVTRLALSLGHPGETLILTSKIL